MAVLLFNKHRFAISCANFQMFSLRVLMTWAGQTWYSTASTRDASPIRQPPHQILLSKQQDAAKTVEDMESKGVIEAFNSP